ncbi:hypothetical protein ACA087_05135 [Pseudomonas chlororaphis]|uniref:hypothetical protein n=1 Tax=Pseudomonas chlororaphis TaxID=587753 RepID=UPI00352BB064
MSSLSHKGVAVGIIAFIVPSALVLVPQRIPPMFSVGMHPHAEEPIDASKLTYKNDKERLKALTKCYLDLRVLDNSWQIKRY